jgi:hypothetical protein
MSKQQEYKTGEDMFDDLDPTRPDIKEVDPAAQALALEKTRKAGMTHKKYNIKNINSPKD